MGRKVPSVGTVAVGLAIWAASAGAEPKSEIKGLVEFRKGDTVIVGGQRVRIADTTRIKGVPTGQTLPLGYEVKARGVWTRDGALQARQLEARPNARDSKEEELLAKCGDIEALYVRSGRALRAGGDGGVISLGGLSTRGAQQERARRILDRLLPPYLKPGDVRLYVVDNREWNAFAMANFAIFVHSGLLTDLDDDEVAIVLGHELAHATLEHTRRAMSKGRWGRLAAGITSIGGSVLSVVGGDVLADVGGDAVRGLGGLGASALSNGFNRGFEDEADRVGVRYAFEGGFQAQKAPALWRRFGERYQDQSGVKTFLFGSHSQSKDRARNLEAEVARNYDAGIDRPSR